MGFEYQFFPPDTVCMYAKETDECKLMWKKTFLNGLLSLVERECKQT